MSLFDAAAKRLHDLADQDHDGKITRQDAVVVLRDLQYEATVATTKATPLGAMFIAFVAGVAVGAIAWAATH